MTKFKLILLNLLILSYQLDGVRIQFIDEPAPADIDNPMLEMLLPHTDQRSFIKLPTTRANLDQIYDILELIKRSNDTAATSPVHKEALIKRAVYQLKQHCEEEITIFKKICPILNCEFLGEILSELQNQQEIRSASSFLAALSQEETIPASTSPSESSDSSSSSSLIRSPVILKPILEAIYSQQTPTSPKLKPLILGPEDLDGIIQPYQMILEKRPLRDIAILFNSYPLEKLDAIWKAINYLELGQAIKILGSIKYLKIRKLIPIIGTIIVQKLQSPEVLEEFKTNPKEFAHKYRHFGIYGFRDIILESFISNYVCERSIILNGPYNDIPCAIQQSDQKIIAAAHGGANPEVSQICFINPNGAVDAFLPLIGHTRDITALKILPNGNIITGSGDKTATLWTLNKELHQYYPSILAGHLEPICQVAGSTNGTIVTSSWDHTAIVWTKNSLNGTYSKTILQGHKNIISAITISSKDKIITGDDDGVIRIWTKNPSAEEYSFIELKNPNDAISSIAVTTNNEDIIVGTCNGIINVWTKNSSTQNYSSTQYKEHSCKVSSILTLSNEQFITGAIDGTVKIWTLNPLTERYSDSTLKINHGEISSITLSPSGNIIIACSDKTIKCLTKLITSDLNFEQTLLISLCQQSPINLNINRQLHKIFESLPIRNKYLLLQSGLIIK